MDALRPQNIAVVDARAGRRRLILFDDAKRLSTSAVVPNLESRMTDGDALVQLARELTGNQSNRIDAIVFVTSASAQAARRAECIASTPFPVYKVTDVIALTEAVPDEWSKFQAIDVHSGTWWLIERQHGHLLAASSAPLPQSRAEFDQTNRHLSAFGFEPITELEGVGERNWPVGMHSISTNVLLHAAIRAVARQRSMDGLHVSRDYDGRRTLTLSATRTISYTVVHVERPVFSMREPALADLTAGRPVLLVVDRNVNNAYGGAIDEYSRAFLDGAQKVVFDAHETRKNATQVARFCRAAAALDMPRNGMFVAVGGGVTLDVVGLAASLYCKGIGYLRIPTTLIGMIDAGLGVKQTVNFSRKKNLVGAFYPPTAVINDRLFLETLPLAQIARGFAEIIKIALVCDCALFNVLTEHGRELFASRCSEPCDVATHVLLQSSISMMQELQPNLYEADSRRIVEFGHSFSPTIEVLSRHQIAHGDAVAIDMQLSTAIAVGRGICSLEVLVALHSLLRVFHLPAGPPPASTDQLLGALQYVRQRRGGQLNLVVPTALGCGAFLQSVLRHEIEDAVDLIGNMSAQSAGESCAGALI